MNSSSNVGSQTQQKLETIQVLRALAAVLVLVEHVFKEADAKFGAHFDILNFPYPVGIDLFFVISGFIMFYTNQDAFGRKQSFGKFLLRRIVRVVPLYYIFTTALVLVLLISPEAMGKTKFDWLQVVTSYLFWPYQRYDGRVCPVLSLGWTLNYEMFFYLIFAGTLFLRRNIAIAVMSLTMGMLVLLGVTLPFDSTVFNFWTAPIILEFLFGVWIAVIVMRLNKVNTNYFVFVPIFIICVVWTWTTHIVDPKAILIPELLQQGVPAALLVFAVTAFISPKDGARLPKWLSALGDSSYALYLSHRFPLRLMSLAWFLFLPKNTGLGWIYIIITLVFCVGVGHMVYLWCERPVLGFLSRRISARQRS